MDNKEQKTEDVTIEPLTDEMMAVPGVLEAVVDELRDRGAIAVSYKKQMDEAKTETKREHFRKKLVANNEEAADLIAALETVKNARERYEALSNEEGDAEPSSSSESPTS